MSSKTQFFLTGATGYIGGAVLARFLKHPDAANFHFTILVRDPTKAAKFNEIPGITAVVGSHNDVPLATKLASEADVVIATADCDDLVAAEATLAGLKQRYATTGVPPIFINTSGTGVVLEKGNGTSVSSTIYDDSNVEQMASIAPTQIHRNVDLAVLAGDAEGYTRTYIVLPSQIYGIATGPFVDLGLQNPHSIALPWLIKTSLDRKCAGVIGEGKNVWPNVEIHELTELYIALYDSITSDPSTGHGVDGYYFGVNGEHSFYEVGKALGETLLALGKCEDSEPTTFTKEELVKYFGGSEVLGSNCRCMATHSLSIGWKPTKTTKDLLESVKPEVEALIAKRK